MESILVLEDDENYRGILADTLEDKGYEVVEAAGAQEAIRLAEQRPFHLILSDVRMAGPIDGVGAIEQIKKHRPHIRSIVLTGYTDLDVPLRAAKVQADDYLFKPVEASQLLDVVRLTLDRESDTLGLLGQILQTPGDLAQKALSWLYDGTLQQLGQLRERCFQRLFVLLRSNRLSPEDAYPVYLQLLEVESQYHQARPGDWSKLLTAYATIESQILAAIAHETVPRPDNPTLTWSKFQRFCKILTEGAVSAEQFHLSALLFLEPALRRANLGNYLAYQKLWATGETSAPKATDPLLGKTFGGYTLHRLLPKSTEVRVYSALDDLKISRLIMAFPPGANAQEIIQAEIQTGKATPLGRHHDFDLVLLNRKDHSLRQELPPGGLLPAATWKLLRPVFLQVQAYHEQGICSGYITPEDIELIPGQTPRLVRFSPEFALGVIQRELELRAKNIVTPARILHGIPSEIASARVNKPIPASDQAMLAFVFSRILLGLETQFNPFVFLLVPSQDDVERHLVWKKIHSACSRSVPGICAILRKMADPDYTKRYSSLQEAISELDQALKPRSLSAVIPPEGLPSQDAWKLLRPLFLQVQDYHRQGIVSGSFDIRSIEVSADGEAQVSHFNPDKSLQHIENSRRHKKQHLNELFAIPNEIAFATVERPLAASDQPPLGRIFAQVLGGPSRKAWYQPLLLHTSDEASWLQLHTPFFKELTPCICRLTRPSPAERFHQMSDAIQAIDQILLKEKTSDESR